MKKRIIIIIICLLLSVVFAEKQESPVPFQHEPFGIKQLDILLDLYDYDSHINKGSGEFEKMVYLKDWVYKNVEYGGAPQYINLRNSLTILEKAYNGEVFWCNNIAAVYLQCGLSLGWTPRYMFLRNTKHESHIANDIWSNEYKKWILMDAAWNIHILKDDIPLSLLEIKAEWQKNNGADLVYVFGAGEDSTIYTASELPILQDDNFLYRLWPVTEEWITFFYEVAILGKNNLFSDENIWRTIYIIKDDLNKDDNTWEFRRKTEIDDMNQLFHDLNRVDINYHYLSDNLTRNYFRIELDAFGLNNYTPNLENFMIKINDLEWTKSDEIVFYQLNLGKNKIQAKIVNSFGVSGPVSEVRFYHRVF